MVLLQAVDERQHVLDFLRSFEGFVHALGPILVGHAGLGVVLLLLLGETCRELGGILLLRKRHRDGLLGEQFPLLAYRGLRHEIDLHRPVQLLEEHLTATVAVDGDDDRVLAVGQIDEFLLDVARTVGADGVLDAAVQKVSNVVAPFHNDEGGARLDVRPAGQTMEGLGLSNGQHGANLFDDGLGGGFAAVDHVKQQFLRALHDGRALGGTDVTDFEDLDDGVARTDAIDGLQRAANDGGLDIVEAAGDDDHPMHLAAAGVHFNVNVTHARGALELAQLKVIAEEALGLAHDGPNDVLALDAAVDFDVRPDFVLHGRGLSSSAVVPAATAASS